jgi:hypothetical protein
VNGFAAAFIDHLPQIPLDTEDGAIKRIRRGVHPGQGRELGYQPVKARGLVPAKTAGAIVTENASARIAELRSPLRCSRVIVLIELFTTRRIIARQPSPTADEAAPSADSPS